MLTLILAALFCVMGLLTALSLADSAVRWRNAWRSLQREMIGQTAQDAIEPRTDVVAFHDIHPLYHRITRGIPANYSRQFDVAA